MRLLLLLCVTMLGGCSAVERALMTGTYARASLSDTQITRDIVYKAGSTSPKHRLDLFRPASKRWPVMVFVHGGGWHKGDKSIRYGGEDVYGNIGRFYAAHGIGVAVVNYRLQPKATWREQVADVADAAAWVKTHIASYGGDPSRIYLAGHSAGGYLASFVALNREVAAQHGVPRIAGVVCVSGAALDLSDLTISLPGNFFFYYKRRFAEAASHPGWQQAVSPATYASPGSPPFLILYAEGENLQLRRQARRFHADLDKHGVPNRLVGVPHADHLRIVLALSRADKTAAPAILDFIKGSRGGE